jgi:hypothetical protein
MNRWVDRYKAFRVSGFEYRFRNGKRWPGRCAMLETSARDSPSLSPEVWYAYRDMHKAVLTHTAI